MYKMNRGERLLMPTWAWPSCTVVLLDCHALGDAPVSPVTLQ